MNWINYLSVSCFLAWAQLGHANISVTEDNDKEFIF